MKKIVLTVFFISLTNFFLGQSRAISIKYLIETVSKDKVITDSTLIRNDLITDHQLIKDSISEEDIRYLIPLVNSKKKCGCLIKHVSSILPNRDEYAELGGYATAIIKFYKDGVEPNNALIWCPKINPKSSNQN